MNQPITASIDLAQPADLLNAEELAALRRFDECAQDGEGYDVPKEMMQRLAEIGVVQRRSGAYYQATEFGVRVLAGPVHDAAAPSDWINDVVRDVAELPDRDSPADQPDMMLVTVNELHDIIARHAPSAGAAAKTDHAEVPCYGASRPGEMCPCAACAAWRDRVAKTMGRAAGAGSDQAPGWQARRYCKGDAEWTAWADISAEQYEQYKGDSSFELRRAPSVTVQDERALFEAWCIHKGYSTNKWHDGGYVDSNTQNGWEVWQGRAAHPVQDGEKDALTQAARDVLAERRRQVEAEGWTPAHDDSHKEGEMAQAAACYAIKSAGLSAPAKFWPWSVHWFKGAEPRRCLVKAGALIQAEIERLDRAAMTAAQQDAKGGAA